MTLASHSRMILWRRSRSKAGISLGAVKVFSKVKRGISLFYLFFRGKSLSIYLFSNL
jgi:arginyl-tRNA--protein-N-Asp/Glu arginylyltransferase